MNFEKRSDSLQALPYWAFFSALLQMSFPTAKKFGVGGNIKNQDTAALCTTETSTYFSA
jgi:hypothetical protein